MKNELVKGDVTLRPMLRSDMEAIWNLYTLEIFEFMLIRVETKEELFQWLEAGILMESCITYVVEHTTTKEIMGTTRIYAIDRVNHSCEIGSTFYGETFQRSHVNTVTKYLLLSYCFESLQMIRVQFKTDEENIKSQRAIERIGAIKEGVLRNERIRSTGKPRNAVIYSIIYDEWPNVKVQIERKIEKYRV